MKFEQTVTDHTLCVPVLQVLHSVYHCYKSCIVYATVTSHTLMSKNLPSALHDYVSTSVGAKVSNSVRFVHNLCLRCRDIQLGWTFHPVALSDVVVDCPLLWCYWLHYVFCLPAIGIKPVRHSTACLITPSCNSLWGPCVKGDPTPLTTDSLWIIA